MSRRANTQVICDRLAARLNQPLPARSVQELHQVEMSFGRHFGPPRHDARSAAVMVLLYGDTDDIRDFTLPLIVRPRGTLYHAGQVSLPGGAIEDDETESEAALRELNEELGVSAGDVQVVGTLSPLYVFSSNHYVTPFVGIVVERPVFRPNPREVSRVLETPLSFLAGPENQSSFERRFGGMTLGAPCWYWDGEPIWGTTAMVLAELIAVTCEASS
jgi:8-oxo-dGTP pyrophosphatase MutT (NUDIX family)